MDVYTGAEATVEISDGEAMKQRTEKGYRHPQLDARLRGERTDREARLLRKARQAGVRTPEVLEEDGEVLILEQIEGDVLKNVFREREALWPVIGENIARLHARDIIHGDLTTSNMIVSEEDLYFIDFGLGFFSDRTEDRATDLHLLDEVLESTHPDVAEAAIQVILDAYQEEAVEAEDVMERYRDVGQRGRYR